MGRKTKMPASADEGGVMMIDLREIMMTLVVMKTIKTVMMVNMSTV